MLEANGWPEKKGALTKTARALRISHQTLGHWARRQHNPPPQKLLREKGFDFLQAMRDELQAIFEEFQYARQDADYRELGTVLGIIVDKLQLIEGKATERIEMMTPDERLNRIAELYDAARARRDGTPIQFVQ